MNLYVFLGMLSVVSGIGLVWSRSRKLAAARRERLVRNLSTMLGVPAGESKADTADTPI